MDKMADDGANMSDGETAPSAQTANKLYGGERQCQRSRSVFRELCREERERGRRRSRCRGRRGYSRSPGSSRSRHLSPRRRSPKSRRRLEGGNEWQPRNRSLEKRDRPLSTARTPPSAAHVVSATQRHLNSWEHHRKIRSHDDQSDDVVLISSTSKLKQKRVRKTSDEYEYEYVSHQNKRQKGPEALGIDILKHQSVFSFADHSTDGSINLGDVLNPLPKSTTITPSKSLSFATHETSSNMASHQGIHPDRIRRLSDDADMDADDRDVTMSNTFETPKVSNFNPIHVHDRRWKVNGASPLTSSISAASLPQDNDSWGVNASVVPANSAPVTAFDSSAHYDDIFAGPLDGSIMRPPPLPAAPFYNIVKSSPIPRPISLFASESTPHTGQQIHGDCFLECNKIEEDVQRREHQGTMKYHVPDEEVEVILSRMNFNAAPVSYAARKLWSESDQPLSKHREDHGFIPDPANSHLNGRGFPLT